MDGTEGRSSLDCLTHPARPTAPGGERGPPVGRRVLNPSRPKSFRFPLVCNDEGLKVCTAVEAANIGSVNKRLFSVSSRELLYSFLPVWSFSLVSPQSTVHSPRLLLSLRRCDSRLTRTLTQGSGRLPTDILLFTLSHLNLQVNTAVVPAYSPPVASIFEYSYLSRPNPRFHCCQHLHAFRFSEGHVHFSTPKLFIIPDWPLLHTRVLI